jgi:hypothetical protein
VPPARVITGAVFVSLIEYGVPETELKVENWGRRTVELNCVVKESAHKVPFFDVRPLLSYRNVTIVAPRV